MLCGYRCSDEVRALQHLRSVGLCPFGLGPVLSALLAFVLEDPGKGAGMTDQSQVVEYVNGAGQRCWRPEHPGPGWVPVAKVVENPETDRKLTIQQAMKETGRSRRTMYNWISRGQVATIRDAGGHIRILASSLWRSSFDEPLNR
jgi:hypothetical protein